MSPMFNFFSFEFLYWWVSVFIGGTIYFVTNGIWGLFRRPKGMSDIRYFHCLCFRIGIIVFLLMLLRHFLIIHVIGLPGPFKDFGAGILPFTPVK